MSQSLYHNLLRELEVDGKKYHYYSLPELKDPRVQTLPYSIRVLLECALRKCDDFSFRKLDVETILDWEKKSLESNIKLTIRGRSSVPAGQSLASGLHWCPSYCGSGHHEKRDRGAWWQGHPDQPPLPS